MPEETFPVWELVRTAHLAGLRFTETIGPAGLTPTQFAVLLALADDEGPSSAEVARRVLVRPQSANALIGGLVDQGLVVRDGPGGRGRRAGVALTDLGRDALERALPLVRAFNAPDALGLTPAQAAMLVELLGHVRSALKSGG